MRYALWKVSWCRKTLHHPELLTVCQWDDGNMFHPVLDYTWAEKLDFREPPRPCHPSYHSLLLYWPGWALLFVRIGLHSLLLLIVRKLSVSRVSDCTQKECQHKVIRLWNAIGGFLVPCGTAAIQCMNTSTTYWRINSTQKNVEYLKWRDWSYMFWQGDSQVRGVLSPQGWAVSTQSTSLQTLWETLRTSSWWRPRLNTCLWCPSRPHDPLQYSHVSVIDIYQPYVVVMLIVDMFPSDYCAVPRVLDCGCCLIGGVKFVEFLCQNVGLSAGTFCIIPKNQWPASNLRVKKKYTNICDS